MKQPLAFTFVFAVAEKPNRWVSDLTVIAVAESSHLTPDEIKDRVTGFVMTGEEPTVLRELRGDIRLDKYWKSPGISTPTSEPIYDDEGLKIFAPIRGVKLEGL